MPANFTKGPGRGRLQESFCLAEERLLLGGTMSDRTIRKAFGFGNTDEEIDEVTEHQEGDVFVLEDDEVSFALDSRHRMPDDGHDPSALLAEMARLLDSITRIGGEVCRLRAEMDGVLETNKAMGERFDRLREVIEEKGTLNMDDFELACEVMTMRQAASPSDSVLPLPTKKIAH